MTGELGAEVPWLIRPFDPAIDDLHYLLGVSYTRSRAGQRAGAMKAGGSRTLAERVSGSTPDPIDVSRQKAFLEAHRPIWDWLVANAEVTLVVDPDATHIIWAWLVTSAESPLV